MFKGFPKHAFPKRGYPTGKIGNVGVVSDNDANNFCITAGITDLVEREAIYFLVTELKKAGLWNRMIAIYPMRGGTADSCSYNLRATTKFKITWVNAPTFSYNGVVGNGTNQYGNLGLNASTQLTVSDLSISFYSRTIGVTGSRCGLGVQSGGHDYSVFAQGAAGFARIGGAGGVPQAPFTGASSSAGLFMSNRSALNNLKAFYNGDLKSTSTSTIAVATVNQVMFVLARNFNAGIPDSYTTQQCAFAHVGGSMNDAEAAQFYSIVQEYQTILGIEV